MATVHCQETSTYTWAKCEGKEQYGLLMCDEVGTGQTHQSSSTPKWYIITYAKPAHCHQTKKYLGHLRTKQLVSFVPLVMRQIPDPTYRHKHHGARLWLDRLKTPAMLPGSRTDFLDTTQSSDICEYGTVRVRVREIYFVPVFVFNKITVPSSKVSHWYLLYFW